MHAIAFLLSGEVRVAPVDLTGGFLWDCPTLVRVGNTIQNPNDAPITLALGAWTHLTGVTSSNAFVWQDAGASTITSLTIPARSTAVLYVKHNNTNIQTYTAVITWTVLGGATGTQTATAEKTA